MADVLLVDDSAVVTELFAARLKERLGGTVTTHADAASVADVLDRQRPFDLAIVDLSFAHQEATGIDVFVDVHRAMPSTRLAVLTTGDGWALELLEVAWHAFALVSVISKTATIDRQLDAVATAIVPGSVSVDGVLRSYLPATRDPRRSAASYGRLIHHLGHAKLWAALLASGPTAEYGELAQLADLTTNTVRNYRSTLLPDLALFGLEQPTMQEMRDFAVRCRALLRPFAAAKGITF